jgi:hypothetical protein
MLCKHSLKKTEKPSGHPVVSYPKRMNMEVDHPSRTLSQCVTGSRLWCKASKLKRCSSKASWRPFSSSLLEDVPPPRWNRAFWWGYRVGFNEIYRDIDQHIIKKGVPENGETNGILNLWPFQKNTTLDSQTAPVHRWFAGRFLRMCLELWG